MRELLDDLDADELQEWIAHYETDPWDEQRADLRSAVIASVIANVHSRKRTFNPSDFVPRYRRRPMSGGDLKAMAMKWTAALGGEFIERASSLER